MTIRLAENFRALFYAPFYAAHALGLYDREGVDVELVTSAAPGDAVPRVLDGSIDLTWAGPMRVMKAHDQDAGSPLVCFGEVVGRDPFFLVARPEFKDATLARAARLRFAAVTEVPTPWLCLQHDLRQQGIDPASVALAPPATMADNLIALRDGHIDVMQAFEPYVSMAERDGIGTVTYAASTRGPTSYTAFIATRDGLARHHDEFAAMVRAIGALKRWLAAHDATDLAGAVTRLFPDVPLDLLTASLARYHAAGIWTCDATVSLEGFTRLAESFVASGALTRMPDYAECVETQFAG